LKTEADLISFQEVSNSWGEALLEGLSETYPFAFFTGGKCGIQGLAVFSKYPMKNVQSIRLAGMPNIEGEIQFADSSIRFVTSHTRSPITYTRYLQRNTHLKVLAAYLNTIEGPVIAIGDFNAVPWDTSILEFKKRSRLQDSRKKITPTFPSFLKFLGIPIDYIFHSKELSCLDFRSIDGTSSDHLGVIGYYKFINI